VGWGVILELDEKKLNPLDKFLLGPKRKNQISVRSVNYLWT